MHRAGVSVGLGTDGPASGNTLDLFSQMRFCANFHKNELRDRSAFPAAEIVRMATCEGAAALGLGAVTGSLEPGKEADIVLVETDSPNMFPVYDPYAAPVSYTHLVEFWRGVRTGVRLNIMKNMKE